MLQWNSSLWSFLYLREFLWNTFNAILGVPGAASGDDAVFSGEGLLQQRKSPWVLIITEPVPEVLEFQLARKIFLMKYLFFLSATIFTIYFCFRISWLSAIQFWVEKSDFNWIQQQRLAKVVFVELHVFGRSWVRFLSGTQNFRLCDVDQFTFHMT